MPAAGAATVTGDRHLQRRARGSSSFNKTIAGPASGRAGTDRQLSRPATASKLPAFVIPAGEAAGDVTHTYPGIPAGASCSVAESVDGHTDAVVVESTGDQASVVVPANGTTNLKLVDTYSPASGSLVVEKTITGAAAGSQGPITIHVHCDDGARASTTSSSRRGPLREQGNAHLRRVACRRDLRLPRRRATAEPRPSPSSCRSDPKGRQRSLAGDTTALRIGDAILVHASRPDRGDGCSQAQRRREMRSRSSSSSTTWATSPRSPSPSASSSTSRSRS